MPSATESTQDDVEVSVGPHPHRSGWRVVRVSYPGTDEHARRVAQALAALTTPASRNAGAHQPSHRKPVARAKRNNRREFVEVVDDEPM